MTTSSKFQAASRPAFKLTRRRIIALVLVLLGAFMFIQAGSVDSEVGHHLNF